MPQKICKFARASMICSAPCILVTILELPVVLVHNPDTVAYAMLLGFAALGLLPVALASLVLVIFAKRHENLCLGLSVIYFAGWAAMLLFT
jgi:hypothetical protein